MFPNVSANPILEKDNLLPQIQYNQNKQHNQIQEELKVLPYHNVHQAIQN
jgi:hypothetical protein